MILRCLAATVLLVLSTPAFATVADELDTIDKKLRACTDKDSSTVGMKQCTGDALDAADKILNRVYKAAVDGLKKASAETAAEDKEILKRLIASERAWIAYKGAECDLQGTSMLGGTGEGLVVGDCLYAMTKERAKSLDALFNGK